MNIDEKLKELSIEDFIWVIYIGIIFLSWYSNGLERKYYLNKDMTSLKKYRNVMIIIFSILSVVYFYFLESAFEDVRNLKDNDSDEKKKLVCLAFFGALCVFISGVVFLYVAYMDHDLNVELAFN